MKMIERLEQIKRVDALIKRKGTGTPCELASRLGIGERTVFELLAMMREMGGPIYYCAERKSYCYEYEVDLLVGFLPKDTDLEKIRGGESYFSNNFNNFEKYYSTAGFLQSRTIYLYYQK
jgi:hypothetical protein